MTPEEIAAAAAAAAQAQADSEAAAAALEASRKAKADKDAADAAAAEAAKTGNKPQTDAEKELLREVMEKKAANKKLAEDKKAAEDKLALFDGIDPAEVKKLLKAQKDAEATEAEKAGNFERVKAMMIEESSKTTAALQKQLDDERAARLADSKLITELTIGSSFSGSKFISESLVLTPAKARTIYGGHFEIVDGQVVGYDKPAGASSRTQLVDGSGNPVPFEAAMQRIIDADPDKEVLMRSTMKPGSNSSTKPGTKVDTIVTDTSGLHGASRIAAGLSKK